MNVTDFLVKHVSNFFFLFWKKSCLLLWPVHCLNPPGVPPLWLGVWLSFLKDGSPNREAVPVHRLARAGSAKV